MKETNESLDKKFLEKFNKKPPKDACKYCVENAINESGYISENEIYKILKPYKEKKKKLWLKEKMGFSQKICKKKNK